MAKFALVVTAENESHVRFQVRVGADDALAGILTMRPDEWAAFRLVLARGADPFPPPMPVPHAVVVARREPYAGGDVGDHLP